MAKPLNLYATKVFAEHPTSMWALDEEVGYIGLTSESDQNLSNWNVSGATVVDARDSDVFSEVPLSFPFEEQYANGLVESPGNGGIITIEAISSIPDNKIDADLGSIAIGFFAFTYDRTVQARVGFSYVDTVTQEEIEKIRLVNIPANRAWAFVAETISLPENVSQIKPIIEFFYTETQFSYELAVNGISVGQWAEEFQTESLGITLVDLPSDIPIDSKAVEAKPYGLQGSSGYYLASETELYAKNVGVPLVYGSENCTRITPNENGKPSLIVPGEGVLNKEGKNKPLTVEFWININSNAIESRKIFGPISSEDGLYVEKHLLKLKIGNYIASHPVKEWGRPMLVSIRLRYNFASLLINGEEVISLSLDPDLVVYPDKFADGNSLDWLGFYAYADVPTLQVEAIAIYPYEVPAIVQKRRFVYGQGVDFPLSLQGLDNSTVTSIDYSVSNYDKNILYPQTNSWSSGYSDNLEVSSTSISLPNYSVPEVYLSSNTYTEWVDAMTESFNSEDPKFSIRPNNDWSAENGYLYLKNLSFLKESMAAFYGLFEAPTDITTKQRLLTFKNDLYSSSLNIYLQDSKVFYSVVYFNDQNEPVEEIFHEAAGLVSGDKFLVGLNLNDAVESFSSEVASALQKLQSAKLYIAGSENFENTFSGNILRVGFCGTRNLQKTQNFYDPTGVAADYFNGSLAADSNKDSHIATYTLVGTMPISRFALDVAVDSYWEDYLPLSYFGSYVEDYQGETFFDLDFLQFNVDYVRLNRFSGNSYDTTGLPIKTYVSFQYLADGANADPNYFTQTLPLPKTGVVRPEADWLTTRYEVLNDSAIKLPVGESINRLAVVISMEFQSGGIISDNLSISSLELASQVLGQSANRIPTKFGSSIIPFKKSGQYFEYKNVEPYTIQKRQLPYLYLTKNSGIRMRMEYSSSDRNGLSIPINTNQSSFFRVNLFQLFLRYSEENFPTAPKHLFEIQSRDSLIQFFLVAASNTQRRGQVYAIDQGTGRLASGIVYYMDGKVVKRPVLNLDSWSALAISFDETQVFDSFTGAFRVTSPTLFNHVSYYQTTQLDEVQRFAYRKWSAVRSGIDNPLDWAYWSGKDYDQDDILYQATDGFSWQEVLFLAEADPTIADATNVYKKYTGTASVIVDTESQLRIADYSSSILKDIAWFTSTSTPV